MSRTFTSPTANKAFGQFKESNQQSDYIINKKAKTTFCGANICTPSVKVNTQSNLLLLNRSNNLKYYNCNNSFNKANLGVNLITKLDLNGMNIIQNNSTNTTPSSIDPNKIPFSTYTIDNNGLLFGNTPCGLTNYVNYMLYNQ
jgi:hypothetical protein